MMLLYPVFKGTCVYGMNTVIGGRQQTEGRENEKTRKRENEKREPLLDLVLSISILRYYLKLPCQL
jgi:hypothetical protein